jgi:hypothetical protein
VGTTDQYQQATGNWQLASNVVLHQASCIRHHDLNTISDISRQQATGNWQFAINGVFCIRHS